MSKHIHLYINRARMAAKVADAGNFDESKHKRDHGKFSSTGGGTTGRQAPHVMVDPDKRYTIPRPSSATKEDDAKRKAAGPQEPELRARAAAGKSAAPAKSAPQASTAKSPAPSPSSPAKPAAPPKPQESGSKEKTATKKKAPMTPQQIKEAGQKLRDLIQPGHDEKEHDDKFGK